MCEHSNFAMNFTIKLNTMPRSDGAQLLQAAAAAASPSPPCPIPIGMSNGSRVVVLRLHLELCDLLDASREWTVNGALHLKQNSQMDI